MSDRTYRMHKPRLMYVVLLLTGIGLGACSEPNPPLRVGILAWPPYHLTYLAQTLKYYEAGLVELVEFQSPAEAARAYLSDNLDVVALTLDYPLDFYAKDPNHRVFVIINESLGGDAVISRDPIVDLSQVAGKRIGLESSALGAHMLYRFLEKAGLHPSDVSLRYFDIPDQLAAYQDQKADVVITYEPTRTQLLALGGHELFSSREIPGEIVDVFLAREQEMRERKDDFRAFAEGWFKAVAHFEQAPEKSADLMAPGLNMEKQEFLATFQGIHVLSLAENHVHLATGKTPFLNKVSEFSRSLELSGRVSVPANARDLFTAELLPAVP